MAASTQKKSECDCVIERLNLDGTNWSDSTSLQANNSLNRCELACFNFVKFASKMQINNVLIDDCALSMNINLGIKDAQIQNLRNVNLNNNQSDGFS